MGSLGVKDAQAMPGGCDPRWVTLAGPCLSFPAESRENERNVRDEPAKGQGELPKPCLPLPRPRTACPHRWDTCRSLRGKRRKQLGGSCSFGSHRLPLPWYAGAHAAASTCRRMHTGACTHMYLQACVCTQKHRAAFMPANTHIHMHAYMCLYAHMRTRTHAQTQPLPDGT